jgi:hypothetical protein
MLSSQPERAIKTNAEDKLERSRFVERLCAALVNPTTRQSSGVVIGITGPWGSGKSSILNLLVEQLKVKHDDALVVRFDPWLVQGRNDLIAEFFGELIGTIKSDEKRFAKFRKLGETITAYGAHLAPLGDIWMPGLGGMLRGGLKAAETALSKKESLASLRSKIAKQLLEIEAPIVVLIDELDRVEDEEIRTVAQLVRSVADFPGISYVLAYDQERVIEALGASAPEKDRAARGRGYLEKIVQLQVPLPITLDEEIARVIASELLAIQTKLRLPESFENIERYRALMMVLGGDVIRTLRDVRRLIGSFHVLAGMLTGEVDWIDLLAYCALLIKAPATAAKIRAEPDDFLDDGLSRKSFKRMAESGNVEVNVGELAAESERNDGTIRILEFLFSRTSGWQEGYHVNALRTRQSLLTTLRLGLLPGAFPKSAIQRLMNSEPEQVAAQLRDAYEKGELGQLIDRLGSLYGELTPSNHVSFWQGVGMFAKKPDCEWITSYQPMHEAIFQLAGVLSLAVGRDQSLRKEAVRVFSNLRSGDESELTAIWLRRHLFLYGLYGLETRGGDDWFLSADQTSALSRDMGHDWRTQHLGGRLIPCRWDLQPVYTMIDSGIWDDPCRAELDKVLEHDAALDGLTLMLYGAAYNAERSTVEKMCSRTLYVGRAKARLKASPEVHETVRVALSRAISNLS